jgi:hypothetical protein
VPSPIGDTAPGRASGTRGGDVGLVNESSYDGVRFMSARDNTFFRSNTYLGLERLLRDLERA